MPKVYSRFDKVASAATKNHCGSEPRNLRSKNRIQEYSPSDTGEVSGSAKKLQKKISVMRSAKTLVKKPSQPIIPLNSSLTPKFELEVFKN